MKLLTFLWLFAVPTLCFSDPIVFSEVSTEAGIDYIGPSFGASWGDANGDGLPDLWLSNRGDDPHLYINNGDGGFVERSSVIGFTSNTDMHGAAWADYDNDGDQDLLLMVGAQSESDAGEGPNQFFVNKKGTFLIDEAMNNDTFFIDEAKNMGLDYPLGRGHTPMWLDWDNDGLLDVVLNNWGRSDGQAPTALFGQSGNGTFDITDIGDDGENSYSQIVMMGAEAKPHILITDNPYPAKIYDYQQQPAMDISSASGLPAENWGVRDTVIADFNGDLLSDLLLLRNLNTSDIVKLDDMRAIARLVVVEEEIGIKIQMLDGGTLDVTLNPLWLVTGEEIFIGAAGANPLDITDPSDITFTLDPAKEAMHGVPSHVPGTDNGVYIGYSPEAKEWTILVSRDSSIELNIEFTSTEQITRIDPIGFEKSDGALPDQMYVQIDGAGFVDETTESGLEAITPSPCAVGTAADFDNDMDVDIYLVCSGPVSNSDNRLLVNDGSGHFTLAENAWGATANVPGLGEVVTSADYDNDGFVDLLVTNGKGALPFNNGPTLLFKNQGNANHWLAVDLEGVTSNRDAIGARVVVTAGGKQQLREQLGGMHQYSQDYRRLQFGLGENTQVDKMVIYWPSGTVQTLLNLPADKIDKVIHVIEAADTAPDNDDSDSDAASTPNGGGGSAVSIYTLALLLLLSGFRMIQRKR